MDRRVYVHGEKRRVPAKRSGITVSAKIGNQQIWLRTGEYPDGKLAEIFIDMYKEGAAFRSILNMFAISVSMGLQYGVPLEVLVGKFSHSRFEPSGMTGNRNIPLVKSIVDYIGRYLALKFLPKEIAKKYHNEELIDRAYAESNPVHLPQLPTEMLSQTKLPAQERQHSGIVAPAQTKEQLLKAQTNMVLALNNEDAPMCGTCGIVMVRNGSCYKCLECGETSGCS